MSAPFINVEELKVLRLSHSSLQKFGGCQQKFFFYKFFKQPRRVAESYAGMVGNALHDGWQEYLITGDRDKALWAMMKAWDVRIPEGKYEARTLEAAVSALDACCNYVDNDFEYEVAYVNVEGKAKPAVEVPFQINFMRDGRPFEIYPGLPVVYIGYIDAIMFSRRTEQFRVRDLKTHRNWETDLTPKFIFDEQCVPYQLIIEVALGKPVKSFEIDYLACYVDLMKAGVWSYSFPKGQDQITDWARGIHKDIMDIKAGLEMQWFKRKATSCMQYGEQVCGFFEVCQSRSPEYWKEYFDLGRKVEYDEAEFKPWFQMDLELAA